MQFRDLNRQYLSMKTEMDNAIQSVIDSTHFIGGPEINELETKLAEYVGVRHCITCANGTDALQLALMAWGIGEGDAVFVPDFTFFSSAEAPANLGATPVFVDIELETFNISPVSLENAIKAVLNEGKLKPAAIVAVDLFGQPADYPAVRQIADRYGIKVLEDGAQGFGGSIEGKKACSFGDISTTSFFPAKPLGCYGDGGAVFTDNDEWADYISSVKVHGKGSNKYDNIRLGMNSRLDTVQAAVLLTKLKHFDDELIKVNEAAKQYNKLLMPADDIVTPTVKQGYISSWAQYSILLNDTETRTKVQNRMKENGIPTNVYYPKPLHTQQVFEDIKKYTELEKAIEASDRVLAIPMGAYISGNEIRSVTRCLC